MNVKGLIINIVIIVTIFTFMAYTHEVIHKNIFYYFGCENITMGLESRGAYTDADCVFNDISTANALNFTQSLNDIIGYLFITGITIMLGMFMKQ